MATPFRLKRSAIASKRPATTDLQLGELALNTYDGYLYTEREGVGLATVTNLTPWYENYGGGSIYYSNSVGIGTTVPQYKLDVRKGSIGGYDALRAPHSDVIVEIEVKVITKTEDHRYKGNGSSLGYTLDGVESPFLTLVPGRTYRFKQDDNSNSSHPIAFYLTANKATQYTGGVTTNGSAGSSGAYTQIVEGDETPTVLHYQCTAHGYMGNAVEVNSNVVNSNYAAILRNGLDVTSGNVDITQNLNVTGNLDVDGATTLDGTTVDGLLDINAGGQANTFKVEDLTAGRVVIAGTGGEIEDSGNLLFNGTDLSASSLIVSDLTSGRVVLAGGSGAVEDNANLKFNTTTSEFEVVGHSVLDTVVASGIVTASSFRGDGSQLTGITTAFGNSSVNSTGIATFSKLSTGANEVGINITNNTITGPKEIFIDPAGVGVNTGSVRIKGDLYVDGSTISVNTGDIEFGDFVVGIASTVPTNALLDGAGIGIGSTGIRKFIRYNNTANILQSSIGFGVTDIGVYKAGTSTVLSKTTLGSTVVNSSLTSVGTLGALTVSGQTVVGSGVTLNANGVIATGIITASSFRGDGSQLTGIDASSLKFGGAVKVQANASGATVTGILTASGGFSGNLTGTATLATDLAINGTNQLLYQAGNNNSAILPTGNSGQILQSNGSGSAPQWVTSAPAGAIEGITIRDESSIVGSANSISTINFIGESVTADAAVAAGIATVTINAISGVLVKAGGANAGTAITAFDFKGSLVDVDAISNTGIATVQVDGLTVKDEGSTVGTANSITSFNFVGDVVTATASGETATVTVKAIAGLGVSQGSGAKATGATGLDFVGPVVSVDAASNTGISTVRVEGLSIKDEGSTVGTAGSITTINFVGAGIAAAVSGGTATVTSSGASTDDVVALAIALG